MKRRNNHNINSNINVCILGPNSVFGDQEIFQKLKKRTTQATVSSAYCEILYIPKKVYHTTTFFIAILHIICILPSHQGNASSTSQKNGIT